MRYEDVVRTISISYALLLGLTVTATAIGQESKKTAVLNSFTGHFVLVGATGDLRFDPHSTRQPTLEVDTKSGGFEVQRTARRGQEHMILPLDGTVVQYSTMTGHSAQAKVTLSGKRLEITKDIQPSGRFDLPTHSVERWNLSRDGKVLKICGHSDSGIRAVTQFRISGCQIYERK